MTSQDIVGAWKIDVNEYCFPDGSKVEPFGAQPIGLLVYTEEGCMSVHVMRRDRKTFPINYLEGESLEETREAFVSSVAYFGSYELDAPRGLIFHTIEGSSIPNWTGQRFERLCLLSGDRLILRSTKPYIYKGSAVSAVLEWIRVRPTATSAF